MLVARSLLCLLMALGLSGCFVLDELDWGAAELDKYSINPNGVRPPPEEEAPAASGRETPAFEFTWKEELPDVGQWWREARSLTSSDKDESIVHCRIRGRDQFMRIDDCQARGGRVGS